MSKSVDLSNFYHLRTNFTIIGLTGRTGCGCSKIANYLEKGFVNEVYPSPNEFEMKHNSFKKYKIVYKYAAFNFRGYTRINYKDVLTYFILKEAFSNLLQFLSTNTLHKNIKKYFPNVIANCDLEIAALEKIKGEFEKLTVLVNHVEAYAAGETFAYRKLLRELFFSGEFISFSNSLHSALETEHKMKRNIILQLVANNLRKSGWSFNDEMGVPENVFTTAEFINSLIKAIRAKDSQLPVKIVIDSMRNPMEILFFKQRFSAFYLMAVNRDDADRKHKLNLKYNTDYSNLSNFFEDEYKGGKGGEFYKSYVRECIEKADIHLTHRSLKEAKQLNIERKDNTSPYFSWEMQLLKYVALIDQPGIVTPSPEERCMQMAYSAKHNSGCISRQVGATVTDEFYSIKSIGWNNTPEGQVPCSLRNVEVLLDEKLLGTDKQNERDITERDPEVVAFTPYERNDITFREALTINYQEKIKNNEANLKGRNVCMCFKALKNSYSEGKNQVHTRSLHAEESAFLQITKYGGSGIKNGKLFTTASPCELCAKKAYQLGIKVIYYVDPYPGISKDQILDTGYNPPEVRLFNGAIGNAYHWLYEPLMAYKDELSLILGQNIQDYATKLDIDLEKKKETIRKQNEYITQLLEENANLKGELIREEEPDDLPPQE